MCLPLRPASRIRLQIPGSKAFPPSYVPSPGPARTAALRPQFAFEASKCDFLAFQKSFYFLLPFFSKNCENHGFWLPKTFPKSIQNASKIDVSKNMRFFMDFCWFLVACCKSRTSNFMRPRNVLLAFHKNQVFAFGMRFWSKKLTKNHSKTRPEPFKNRC